MRCLVSLTIEPNRGEQARQQQQQHSLFSQASWGRLEMKPERNKFKGEQARKDIK